MVTEKITRGERPLILVTNDDGINARGIQSLAEFLMPMGSRRLLRSMCRCVWQWLKIAKVIKHLRQPELR